MATPDKPLTLEQHQAELEKAQKQAEREKNALSLNGLAARELYEISKKAEITSVPGNVIENMINGLEMSDMEFLATLQAEVRNLHGKELKPVVIPQMYKVILRAWTTIKKAEKDPNVNKEDLSKKKEFFTNLYHLITTEPSYKSQIPDLAKFDKLN